MYRRYTWVIWFASV